MSGGYSGRPTWPHCGAWVSLLEGTRACFEKTCCRSRFSKSDLDLEMDTPFVPGGSFTVAQAVMEVCLHSGDGLVETGGLSPGFTQGLPAPGFSCSRKPGNRLLRARLSFGRLRVLRLLHGLMTWTETEPEPPWAMYLPVEESDTTMGVLRSDTVFKSRPVSSFW